MSLSAKILTGLFLGAASGLFFGEWMGHLKIVGSAFIMLLQMTVLPYIMIALITGLGSLTAGEARILAVKGGMVLGASWLIAFALIFLSQLTFPEMLTASFFSTAILEERADFDFLGAYIPANPFFSLANNLVPGVVLFSIAVGVALIGITNKSSLIESLTTMAAALNRVTKFVVQLMPYGVFAIAAAAAGTMTVEEFGRLQVYFVTFIVFSLVAAFWILPSLISTLTPFSYRDVFNSCKDALLTAFSTGNLFIVLPILVESSKELFAKHDLRTKESESLVDVIIPVSFNFPNIGKLLTLSFVLFAAWFTGSRLGLADHTTVAVSGLVSYFGSINIALPFLLDAVQIPADMFDLFLMTGVVNWRFQTLLGAIHVLFVALVGTCAITGYLQLDWRKLSRWLISTGLVLIVTIVACRTYLAYAVGDEYTKDKVIAQMHLLKDPVSHVVHWGLPDAGRTPHEYQSRLDLVLESGVLRVGFLPDRLPLSYTNAAGDLVGLDVEMAHKLARELDVRLEFFPTSQHDMAEHLDRGYFDIVMSSVAVTTDRLSRMSFARSHLDATLALIVKDHMREQFASLESLRRQEDLTIGLTSESNYFEAKVRRAMPNVEVARLESLRGFFEKDHENVDALLYGAEPGAAWTLLYPKFTVVIPRPVQTIAVAYPVRRGELELAKAIGDWIGLKQRDRTIDGLYSYWILGEDAVPKTPRWSIIRNVLHWVE